MKKRKTYEISVIDKTYSKIISDETKFYTSDTALELVFKLKETEYNFESAEIVLLNIDDRSLVTRSVAKNLDGFAYELDDDIIAHYGEWRGQVRFEQAGETYVSSPVKFRIENDLGNDRPPQLSDVQSWVSLKRYADSLTEELKQAVLSIEGIEDIFNANELGRQSQFESAEQSRQMTFNTNEDIRQTQELKREGAEATRQTVFDNNEANRTETFNANEATRQGNETKRQQAENERQSAELIRVENEEQRNLTSVDEFIKLQDAVGGRNYLLNSDKPTSLTFNSNNSTTMPLTKGVENGVDYIQQSVDGKFNISTYVLETYANNVGVNFSDDLSIYSGKITFSIDIKSDVSLKVKFISNLTIKTTNAGEWTRVSAILESKATRPPGIIVASTDNPNIPDDTKLYWRNIKIEKGTQATPYTKAPEDYTVVSKDDYYNHIKIMSDHRDKQMAELKTAITALGGA